MVQNWSHFKFRLFIQRSNTELQRRDFRSIQRARVPDCAIEISFLYRSVQDVMLTVAGMVWVLAFTLV